MRASSLLLSKVIDDRTKVRVVFIGPSFKGSFDGLVEWFDDSKSAVLIRPDPNPSCAEILIQIDDAVFHYGDERDAMPGFDFSKWVSILTMILPSGESVHLAEIR